MNLLTCSDPARRAMHLAFSAGHGLKLVRSGGYRQDVLSRPEQRLATHMSEADVAGFLSAFASAAEPVEVHFLWRPQLADPADELVLEAAVNGRAQAIVTHDTRHFLPAANELGVHVLTPAELLKRVKA